MSEKRKDKLVASVDDLSTANAVRSRLLTVYPRLWIYVAEDRKDGEFKVTVTNEWGGEILDHRVVEFIETVNDIIAPDQRGDVIKIDDSDIIDQADKTHVQESTTI